MKHSAVTRSNVGISVTHERLVVAGGTQGIGEAVAYRFSKAGAEVWIIGRNEAKGKSVVSKLEEISKEQKITPLPQHYFFKADLSLISEAKRVAETIRHRAGSQGVEYLVMTQGGPPNGTFTPTSETHDQHYAVQVLSRFVLAHDLASNPNESTIKKAVMSIMAPGQDLVAVDYDDLEMLKAKERNNYGIIASVCRDSAVVDSFTKELSSLNSNVNFTHIFPGSVKTNVFKNSGVPWYLSLAGSIMFALMGRSPESYAEIPFYLLANPGGKDLAKEIFLKEDLGTVKPHPSVKDEVAGRKIWDHLLSISGKK